MTKAIIHKRTRNAMQSGNGSHLSEWLLEYAPHTSPHFIYPLMGWTGGTDTTRQIQLWFDSMESAIKYAETHHIPYEVLLPKTRRHAPKSYADNFRYDKVDA